MKQFRRCQRILILSLLSFSVIAPIIFVSHKLKVLTSIGRKESIEDLSSIKYRSNILRLNAVEQESVEGLEEPKQVVYKDKDFLPAFSSSSKKNISSEDSGDADDIRANHERREHQRFQQEKISSVAGEEEKFNQTMVPHVLNIQSQPQRKADEKIEQTKREQSSKKAARHDHNVRSQSHKVSNEKIKEMEDQVVRAKAYLNFAPPGRKSHLVKELKLRIKEMERTIGEATKDSVLSSSALQKMRHMESSLSKASRVFPDCSAMAAKLRAMTYTAEEQVRSQRNQVDYLVNVAARTTPKGLHCLSMQLTAKFFSLQPEERKFPDEKNVNDPKLYHYAVFSDNVLACAVVVNSTVSTSMEPEKIVFHVVTNSLNLPAISMWFLLNPPGKATIQIQSIESFKWLSKYNTLMKQTSSDPRYTSELNHLRFHLPDVFPALNKIVLFDHDVVVQRELTGLWKTNMKGKVIGVIENCQEGEVSFHKIDMLINFSDPFIAKKFDASACAWAFGMNLFDLQEWRRQNLTAIYHKYLQMVSKRPLWMAGSLPLGWITFYKKTVALDRRWHVVGLGYDSSVEQGNIQRAAVVHYDGVRKPWSDIAVGRYSGYWSKFLKYDHPYLQQCNIHE
ncbi:Hexosyltransferase [Quillaja saponaria]|uniref:Hexosyltransferase n=1 Tax=Quillaja saponaria TaxID=32244 RepID=A0AAD7Q0N5_QUISA|nr:Hexosyltransferase [Quillaja saponaria]